jgi:hypothetical protein
MSISSVGKRQVSEECLKEQTVKVKANLYTLTRIYHIFLIQADFLDLNMYYICIRGSSLFGS